MNSSKSGLILLFIFIIHSTLVAQNSRLELQKKREAANINSTFNGFVFPSHDSILHVNLGEVEIIQPYTFKNNHQKKKYTQLEVDIKKTYPIALIVGSELKLVEDEIKHIYTDKQKQKIYIKWYQDYVRRTYMDTLKNLNLQQGRLLLKLIDRETGRSPYELIKSYRGSWNAYFWQSAAFMFGANLKSSYDPEEDKMIEHVIRRYKNGELN